MSKVAKVTLVGAVLASTIVVWGVHFLQRREADTMHQGVLRDDERRKEKMRQREAEFLESQRKRALYESVQHVPTKDSQPNS
ncbi:unnamed protein product [Somion occarium]|uniref:Cytochrome c oxidase assembly protein n=1 Tax=Somion occarium TaxID=3059160 RepID=A0ABP1E7C7_9APHY